MKRDNQFGHWTVGKMMKSVLRRSVAMLALIATVTSVLVITSERPAEAAGETIIAEANIEGGAVGTLSMSAYPWVEGQVVRVTLTLGEAVPWNTVPMKRDDGDDYYLHSGYGLAVAGLAWNGRPVVNAGTTANATVHMPRPDSPRPGMVNFDWVETPSADKPQNYYFAPGDKFWIDVIAPEFKPGPFDGLSVPLPYQRIAYYQIKGGVQTYNWIITHTVAPRPAFDPAKSPVAKFEFIENADDPRTVAFTDHSELVDNVGPLTYEWNFGDGSTSTEQNPTHKFPHAGKFTVTLTVTDPQGRKGSVTEDVQIDLPTVVNSTGDQPAVDVATRGCDTGNTVGADHEPECTLRAAMQTVESRGGGDIRFGIDSAGIPTISAATQLPTLTKPASIDGTSQSAGKVSLDTSGQWGLALAGAGSSVKGMIVNGPTSGAIVVSGSNSTVENNTVGLSATGSATDTVTSIGVGVGEQATGVTVRGNTVRAGAGVFDRGSNTVIDSNLIGVTLGGNASVEGTKAGVVLSGANATMTNNTLHGESVGVLALATGSGAKIQTNRIGINSSGTSALSSMGHGVVISGASGSSVTDNVITSGGDAAISVVGSQQTTTDAGGEMVITSYGSDDATDGQVTGGSATITGNKIGVLANGVTVTDPGFETGILVWANAGNVDVHGNTILGSSYAGVHLDGGSGHRVFDNRVGVLGNDVPAPVHSGIVVERTSGAEIGIGSGNRVAAIFVGIGVGEDSAGTKVNGNSVTGIAAGNAAAVDVEATATATTIDSNTVTASAIGIRTLSPGAVITGNHLDGGEVGINSSGAKVVVQANRVIDHTTAAVSSSGSDAQISDNQIGLNLAGTPVGNSGDGIRVTGGPATLSKNVVIGSGGKAVSVSDDVVAILKGNRISDTTKAPIAAPESAPDTPSITAAVGQSGEATRTTLVIGELPKDGTGTLEVFANSSCDGSDGEADVVTGITRTKKAGQSWALVQIKNRGSLDHFTVTYTDATGTSALSPCSSIRDYPDTDGDGAVDPFEAPFDADKDPKTAIIATDTEDFVALGISGIDKDTDTFSGRLSRVGAVNDPSAHEHPTGFSLPFGVLSFEIDGIEKGSRVGVTVSPLTGEIPAAGSSYWKYGPASPGATPSWYEFAFENDTSTGAVLQGPEDGIGLTRAFKLVIQDGGRGDDDGSPDGHISDPGGPVVITAAPADPNTPTTTVAPEDPTKPPTSVLDSSTGTSATGSTSHNDNSRESAKGVSGAPAKALSYTGSNTVWLVLLAVVLLGVGFGLILVDRRSRFSRVTRS